MTLKNALLAFRNAINILDKNLINLLAKRKQLSLNIAHTKVKNNYPVRDIEREQMLLKNLTILGEKHFLNKKYIESLFSIILEDSVLTQKKWIKKYNLNKYKLEKISFLGSFGSYSHLAAQKYAKKHSKILTDKIYKNFSDVITSVEQQQSTYAILPIENQSSGLIIEVYKLLQKTPLFIIGNIYIHANHCLLAKKYTPILKIQKIYSHIQPFKQCSKFISLFPNWKLSNTTSTSEAIQHVAKENDNTIAALGNESYGELNKLEVIAKNISNKRNNITQFIILAQKKTYITNKKTHLKTIILISKKNENCEKIIRNILHKNKITLLKLKYYVTSKVLLEKIFFIEIENIYCIKHILKQFTIEIKCIKILGCF
ncbi:P-protein [Buchnera aphidicola str. Bp (Baizongia pistaciae)]|uniref:Bifunctional chorismate mutase/prephenate dehydratase n=1 Tax=Buchnera aphidicola subsp. Baizongia pistaciae (strain Bp) TaxID=224915 RepID=CMPDT_BUCBP|nr:chorismate mutase [Buchnera aphidicola]Q89AE5.1 RecName: Full=Bifunctional chorismate mutase/prephenate dehydratase; AltName: Full=Chorismate mutase-prephenate dehydratase; AltName: Full=P-protein; Includes: RecName: Full=Chorismate mutase; Short=CM; Includes: RecName: Full=Prephenate dehydratase; Short=PDT [Buchnera aphidicola str. Bp (Baizongia pistaciae)]AAO27074.1 P-protein [Buchnera aphidicola str. Bp (Baizongia pistaciae)]